MPGFGSTEIWECVMQEDLGVPGFGDAGIWDPARGSGTSAARREPLEGDHSPRLSLSPVLSVPVPTRALAAPPAPAPFLQGIPFSLGHGHSSLGSRDTIPRPWDAGPPSRSPVPVSPALTRVCH